MASDVRQAPRIESFTGSGPIFLSASVTDHPPTLHLSVAEETMRWHWVKELPAPEGPFRLQVHYDSPALEVRIIPLEGKHHVEVFTVK